MADDLSLETPAQFVKYWFWTVLGAGDWRKAMSMCTDSVTRSLAGKFVDAGIESGVIPAGEAFTAAGALAERDTTHPLWPTFAAYWVRVFRLEAQGYELGFRDGFAAEVPEPHVMVCPVDDITLPLWMVVVRVGDGPPRIDGFDDVTGRRID